jgi:hypothetical protein
MEVTLTTAAPASARLDAATSAYAAAFGQPPYQESPEQAAGFAERVLRYARERDGMRLVTVSRNPPAVDGVALAVLARPGDWWRDQAAGSLAPAEVSRWLGDLCLEVVHVAVAPAAQRQKLGLLLHDVLISGRPAPTAVLSCHPAAHPAQQLYLGRGWTLLTRDFRAGGQLPYWLMAREL